MNQTASGLRTAMGWSARVIGLFAIGLYFLFIFDSGLRIVPTLSWSEFRGIPLFLALTVAVLGLVIAWGWQVLGGFLTLAGGASIVALAYAASGPGMTFTAALLALPLLTASLLHLVCSAWTRLSAQPETRAPQPVRSRQRIPTGVRQCRLKPHKKPAHA